MIKHNNHNFNFISFPFLYQKKSFSFNTCKQSCVNTRMNICHENNSISNSQWEIFRDTFTGRWEGTSKWYDKSNWNLPNLIINKATYDISFKNKNNAVWRGNGLRFTNNELVIDLKKGDNWDSKFLFPGGFGGQSLIEGLSTKIPKQFHELNFFDKNSRSMIISEYTYDEDKNILGSLSSIQITPFRKNKNIFDKRRRRYDDENSFFNSIKGWRGERWSYTPTNQYIYTFDEVKSLLPVVFDPNTYTNMDFCKLWDDNLICGLPLYIKKNEINEFIYGCKVNDNCFKQLKIVRDKNNKLISWTFDIYKK